ncbi:cytochrome C biogenesis protein [Sulfuricella sp. T08]|uniref:c-type cytochrome biogenesis protein CcmI n=1 Tax=Sulfuricella sp. T08 TaxID=1632857 RepID=UPI000617A1D0|nr:c-type cytochrome biogenesis protein CcmI [Sulfuricella sp. T08]GAO36516.1 cytochrome C biogenesis protein [Sulfuricella sp. T08]
MSNFWTISLFWALFLLFIAVALAFVLPPLLRRDVRPGRMNQVDRKEANVAIYYDQLAELKADLDSGDLDAAQYEDARREIEKRLSEDVPLESAPVATVQAGRWPGFVLAGAIPVLAIALYVSLGNPEALLTSRTEAPAAVAEQGQHDAAPMIAALEAKLKAKPDDAAGWYMLARSYASIGKFDESARAFEKAAALLPDDARLLADYADALAMAQGQSLQGKPLELINKALKLNPNDEKTLNLAASAAYQSKDFAQAAAYWRRLLKLIPPEADIVKDITAAIEEADKLAGSLGGLDNLSQLNEKGSAGEKTEQPQQGAAAISGMVTVSKELIAKLSPADKVFIFAQAPQGPKMPIASLKLDSKQLPYHFTLDDSVSMSPSDKLSNHAEVMISARVSKSGQPMAQSGDLQGKIGPVKLGQQGVAIVIDTVVP